MRSVARKSCGCLRTSQRHEEDKNKTQDFVAEPVARLIVDFLLVACGSAQPEAYRRLLDIVVYSEGVDDEQEYRARSRWDRYTADVRCKIAAKRLKLGDRKVVAGLVAELVAVIGRDCVVALSSDYAQGDRLDQLINDIVTRISDLSASVTELPAALAALSADRTVRIMSIHKSKGLEFETVIILGVEEETFWGKADEERSAYFVGISRAKTRLLLTVSECRETPQGAKRWEKERTEHSEFLGYAEAYA